MNEYLLTQRVKREVDVQSLLCCCCSLCDNSSIKVTPLHHLYHSTAAAAESTHSSKYLGTSLAFLHLASAFVESAYPCTQVVGYYHTTDRKEAISIYLPYHALPLLYSVLTAFDSSFCRVFKSFRVEGEGVSVRVCRYSAIDFIAMYHHLSSILYPLNYTVQSKVAY